MDENQIAGSFFDAYRGALLDRDAATVATMYAVPALIAFPGQMIAVSDSRQTEEFFAGAFGQYADVTTAGTTISIVAATAHSIWADVAWDYHGGASDERNMYQLVDTDSGWKIAVLTPLDG